MIVVLYEVWIQDERGNYGYLQRTSDGAWGAKPAWLTGWLSGFTVRQLGSIAKRAQSDAAHYWADDDDQKRVANDYLMARWLHTAYILALRWERQYGEPTGRKVL